MTSANPSSTITTTSSSSSSPAINKSPLKSQSSMNSVASTSNPSSSNPTTKGSRSKGKSSATNSKTSSANSSPTAGNVLPKGIPSGPDAPPQICSNCQTTSTPLWRRDGKGGLCCNSCQLWAKTKGYPRPMSLKTDVIKPRIRQSKGGPKKKTKKQLAIEAANGGEANTNSNASSQKVRKVPSEGVISGETSPDLNVDRDSSPASSRSYSRSYSGSASPPHSTSGRASGEGYHQLSHSQHLPTPPSGLHHSVHSSNGGVNLPSLSRLLAETGQQPQQAGGGHQSAPSSHRPSLDGNWSPQLGDAEQEAAYALASRRAGKLPEGPYSPHYPHPLPHHSAQNQRTISRRGSVPSLFGNGGVGQHSSNVRGGESGSASASGESSPRSNSFAVNAKTEDVSEYYSNMNVSGRPLPPLKRERDTESDLKSISGVNIPGTSTHHSTSSLRASSIAGDRDARGGGRLGPDGEALRFGVSPRSRADVDAGFARGRPYSSLRDSETNSLFANPGRYPPGGPTVQGMSGPIGLSPHHSQSLERFSGAPGPRSHSQVPPTLSGNDYAPSPRQGSAAPSSRSSSTGRVPISGSSAARASSLSRIDSSSNSSSPRGSPFASPRGSPSRTMEPLPLNVSSHHVAHHGHHQHSYHPYASPNQSPLLNPRDGSSFQQHQSYPHNNSAAAALDVLGAAASERLIDEGLTSRSTVSTNALPALSSIASNTTSSPLNPNNQNSQVSPKLSQDPPRGRTGGVKSENDGSRNIVGPAMAAQEGSMYWARRGNAEGPALCSYHRNHSKSNNSSSDDPIDSMDLDLDDPPAHGAQPQLRYLDCGCSPDEALFEMACERKGIKGLDPKSRRNLLSLERKRNGYKEGDWED